MRNAVGTQTDRQVFPQLFLNWQSHQDLLFLENPMKVLVLIGNPLVVA